MISVVIPLYNKEKNIKDTIASVLNQTFQDFEIVIVNDGSTDNSVKKVNEIKDSRIRLIHKENGGVSGARNRGIEEAKFDWIALLDGDDLWAPEHLMTLINLMNAYPNVNVFATSFKYSDNREVLELDNDMVIKDFYAASNKHGFLVWTSCVMIHKRCFIQAGKFNEGLVWGEDIDMWIRLAKNYPIVKSRNFTATYKIDAANRAMTKKIPYNKDFGKLIDLKTCETDAEKEFLRQYLLRKTKIYVYNFQLISIMKLIFQHNIQLLK